MYLHSNPNMDHRLQSDILLSRHHHGACRQTNRWRPGSECFSALQPLWNILNSTRVCLVPITPLKGVLHVRYRSILRDQACMPTTTL